MYGRGVQALLGALPRLTELGDEQAVRRLLSGAWLELAERRELGVAAEPSVETAALLRRLALALQVHTFLVPDANQETVRAAAFVAAEALDIADSYGLSPSRALERITVGLLYVVAGYDANAAVAVRDVEPEADLDPSQRFAMAVLLSFLSGTGLPADTQDAQQDLLHERVRALLWREIGQRVASFVRWLRDPRAQEGQDRQPLIDVAAAIRADQDSTLPAGYADIDHLLGLVLEAIDAAAERALRAVAAPKQEAEAYSDFLVARCRNQPLLWPAAATYARLALPGPSSSAIVAVPTGAGKSAVADLALEHAATRGWVLYLAPTNALVAQIRRQLRADHPGLTIREFFGGAEYTTLEGETLKHLSARQVFVMTPEKCSLALRQSPDAFGEMTLCILDEAHLLADRRGRGQLTELVLSEVLTRAPGGRVLLMSALIANPEALAGWLTEAHDEQAITVREPWRPTRTLRAVIGVEDQTLQGAAADAAERLAGLHVRRRNVRFDAPLAALAGLYGPWSTDDEADYALVRIAAEIPINVTRPARGGEITIDVSSVTVRPSVEALAQLLGVRGQKVMAFLPRSKHDSFAAALSIRGFGGVRLPSEIDALLELASAELGVGSLLSDALGKGVGVHTSALLTEERRASELAFEGDVATVLFATGTLAQGLNLPATTVIIGGTEIGYDPDQTHDEKRSRERTQLLNAIGRAGRARVAARSLALVVPTRLPVFDDATPASSVLARAEFLAEEDASTNVLSALRPLLQRLLTDGANLDDVHRSDHVALSYLAPTQDDPEFSNRLLRGTWAAHQLRIRDELEQVTANLAQLSGAALTADDAPLWAAEAARRAAVPIPSAARLANFILALELQENPPTTVDAWAEALVDGLATFSPATLGLILDRRAFASTALDDIWEPDGDARQQAFAATRAALNLWLAGLPLADVGGVIHGGPRLTSPGRGPRDPIPRTIRVIEQGFAFGVTRAAGAMAAVVELAVEAGDIEELSPESLTALELLPVALRYGASGDLPLAFMRAGARPRVVAHLLAANTATAPLGLDAAELHAWAAEQLDGLTDQISEMPLTEPDRVLLEAFVRARGSR